MDASLPDVAVLGELHFLTSGLYLSYVLDPSEDRKAALDATVEEARERASLFEGLLFFGEPYVDPSPPPKQRTAAQRRLTQHRARIHKCQGYERLHANTGFRDAWRLFEKERVRAKDGGLGSEVADLRFLHIVARSLAFFLIQGDPETRWAPAGKTVLLQALGHVAALDALLKQGPRPMRRAREELANICLVLQSYLPIDRPLSELTFPLNYENLPIRRFPRIDDTFPKRCFANAIVKGFYCEFDRPLSNVAEKLLFLVDSSGGAELLRQQTKEIASQNKKSWMRWFEIAEPRRGSTKKSRQN